MAVYSFSPTTEAQNMWTRVDTLEPGEIIYCCAEGNTPIAIKPGQTVNLPGVLKLDVTNREFLDLNDEDLRVRVVGCAVGTDAVGAVNEVYQDYLISVGE